MDQERELLREAAFLVSMVLHTRPDGVHGDLAKAVLLVGKLATALERLTRERASPPGG